MSVINWDTELVSFARRIVTTGKQDAPFLTCLLCGDQKIMARSHFISNADLVLTGHFDRTFESESGAPEAPGNQREADLFTRTPRWTQFLFCDVCEGKMSAKLETASVRESFKFGCHGLLAPSSTSEIEAWGALKKEAFSSRPISKSDKPPRTVWAWYSMDGLSWPNVQSTEALSEGRNLKWYLLMTCWRCALAVSVTNQRWGQPLELIKSGQQSLFSYLHETEPPDNCPQIFVTLAPQLSPCRLCDLCPLKPCICDLCPIYRAVHYGLQQLTLELPFDACEASKPHNCCGIFPAAKMGRLLLMWCAHGENVPEEMAEASPCPEKSIQWCSLVKAGTLWLTWWQAFIKAYIQDRFKIEEAAIRATAKEAINAGYGDAFKGVDISKDDVKKLRSILTEIAFY